ncbi:MAG: hypothetical protein ACP5D2_00805 [Candidatus Nanoarchaeia archaeon]
MHIFGNKKQEAKPKERHISDILVNDSDAERKWGLLDYTQSPEEFLTDVHNFPFERRGLLIVGPIVKLAGLVKGFRKDPTMSDNNALCYDGFLLVGDKPFYFEGKRLRENIPDFELEEAIFRAGRETPITMTAGVYNENDYYKLRTFVVQLGEYSSPPRR